MGHRGPFFVCGPSACLAWHVRTDDAAILVSLYGDGLHARAAVRVRVREGLKACVADGRPLERGGVCRDGDEGDDPLAVVAEVAEVGDGGKDDTVSGGSLHGVAS